MEEEFDLLYKKLYNEHFKELERYRKRVSWIALETAGWMCVCFFIMASPILPQLMPIGVILLVMLLLNMYMKKKRNATMSEKSYEAMYREKIVLPLIKKIFSSEKYYNEKRMPEAMYLRGKNKSNYDHFSSSQLVEAIVTTKQRQEIPINFAYISTSRGSGEEFELVFSGLVACFELSHSIKEEIYIETKDDEDTMLNKSTFNIDVEEFEDDFKIECKDKILAMRILTSDIMAELVEIFKKYNIQFSIKIVDNFVQIKIYTSSHFSPDAGETMKYEEVKKDYSILKTIELLVSSIYYAIDNVVI